MTREINLLPEKEASQERRESLNRRVVVISVFILIATSALVVGSFAYWGITLREKSTIAKEISENTIIIESNSRSEFLQLSLKAKLVKLAEIIINRTDFEDLLSKIQESVVEGVSLSDVGLNRNGDIVMIGQARTSIYLASFLNGLINKEKAGKYFIDVTVKTVSADRDGIYKFSITMKSINQKKPSPDQTQ